MTQKTISQESAATRLLTGALVEIQDPTAGSLNVSVDTLLQGPTFDSPTQFVGYTSGNTMEVEAHSLAARLTLRPDEINDVPSGWQVGRHCYAGGNFSYASANAIVNSADTICFEFDWINVTGIAIIKKVLFDFAIGVSGYSDTGSARASLYRTFGLGPVLDPSNVQTPGSQTGLNVSGRTPQTGCSGLKRQPPPQARINAGVQRTTRGGGALNGQNAWTDPNPIGVVTGPFVAASAGKTLFRHVTLYDWLVAEQPFILTPGTGFEVHWQIPNLTNSNGSATIMPFATVFWDEWTLNNPGDAL